MSSKQSRSRPRAADDFDFIATRRRAIRCEQTPASGKPANLRDLIERGDVWWPEDVVTDGADHFVISRAASDGGRA